jgi:hypothetical protein
VQQQGTIDIDISTATTDEQQGSANTQTCCPAMNDACISITAVSP